MKLVNAFLLLCFGLVHGQQLKCTVQINSDKISLTNKQVFKTLENSLTEFINKTDFTGEIYKPNEKINCSMVLIIDSYDSNQFTGSLQVQSMRPIFNSTYSSPVFNYNDKDLSFSYVEFENLNFNTTTFESNLVSMVEYYCYIILGLDADTYSLKGGKKWFDVAQQIMNAAQQGGYKGWRQSDGNLSRFFLISDMLSCTYDSYREAMYQYHKEALDIMHKDLKSAKNKIVESLNTLYKVYDIRPNSFMARLFFDAKSDEIVSILSGGPKITLTTLIDNLNRISPNNASKWSTIKI